MSASCNRVTSQLHALPSVFCTHRLSGTRGWQADLLTWAMGNRSSRTAGQSKGDAPKDVSRQSSDTDAPASAHDTPPPQATMTSADPGEAEGSGAQSAMADRPKSVPLEESSADIGPAARTVSSERETLGTPDNNHMSPSSPMSYQPTREAGRKESEGSVVFSDEEGGGSNNVDTFFEKAAKKARSRDVDFKKIEHKISTGDLALLYRVGQSMPHLAVFIQNAACDPHFPLLLVKGKTKPLPLERFNPRAGRFAHPVTAATRIFYGDYERVEIRHLRRAAGRPPTSCSEAIEVVEAIQRTPFAEGEIAAARDASLTDSERSALLCTSMAAHFYKLTGVLDGDPSSTGLDGLLASLDFVDPISVALPPPKPGPLRSGDPPFLAKLV